MFRRLARIVLVVAMAVLGLGLVSGTASAAGPYSGLMWWNYETGEVSTWVFDTNGVVVGTQRAGGAACDLASGCGYTLRPVAVGDLDQYGEQDVVWQDLNTGAEQIWWRHYNNDFDTVQTIYPCPSGCTFKVIGIGDINGDYRPDVVDWSPSTGRVGADLYDDEGRKFDYKYVTWSCTPQSGCANVWRPIGVADMNQDGHQDIVWYNARDGYVASWLLNGDGVVLGEQYLDWRCSVGSGCANDWYPVTIGDVDDNWTPDLIWRNVTTGEVSAWLLNARGTVVRALSLNWRQAGWVWRPFGYIPSIYL